MAGRNGGAMGGATLTGFDLVWAPPHLCVMVITGDTEQLMVMGGLATIGVAPLRNFGLIVREDHHFCETVMPGSHTRRGVNPVAVAQACGFAQN